ncbi:hypothetical protein COO60DRAFT_1475272 [Scenedesmus sp. NREL 46B-D3]|nr:hypothetical protein COO60DRAFT_1475272 [Scenedesmus sp. NREL 46B-D3]
MGRMRSSSTVKLRGLWTLLLLGCLRHVFSFPAIYVARYQQQCTDHPATNFGKVHDYSSAVDKTVVFTLTHKATGKVVKPANGASRICLGDAYTVKLSFGAPSPRNYLLTSSHGSFVAKSNDCDAWCPNRICSSAPAKEGTALFSVPCSVGGGTKVSLKVTTAAGRIPAVGAVLRSASLGLTVDRTCGKCSIAVERSSATLRG